MSYVEGITEMATESYKLAGPEGGSLNCPERLDLCAGHLRFDSFHSFFLGSL